MPTGTQPPAQDSAQPCPGRGHQLCNPEPGSEADIMPHSQGGAMRSTAPERANCRVHHGVDNKSMTTVSSGWEAKGEIPDKRRNENGNNAGKRGKSSAPARRKWAMAHHKGWRGRHPAGRESGVEDLQDAGGARFRREKCATA